MGVESVAAEWGRFVVAVDPFCHESHDVLHTMEAGVTLYY